VFVAIIHAIVTVGADLCVPSPNSNINRLIGEVTNQQPPGSDPCLDPTFSASSVGVICFYQNCTGPNLLRDIVSPITVDTGGANSALSDFQTTIQNNHAVVSPQCFPSISLFFNQTAKIDTLIQSAVDITLCSNLNPVYAKFVYGGFCEGLVNGLVFTYVSCIIAAVFMMLAMSMFRIFDFHKYEEGRLPEAYVVDELPNGQVINNGQVISAGGPIQQKV